MKDKFQKELRKKWELIREAQARYVQNVPLMNFLKQNEFERVSSDEGLDKYVKQIGPNTVIITPYGYADGAEASLVVKYGDEVIWNKKYPNVKNLIAKVEQAFSVPSEATLQEAVAYLNQ